MIGMLQGTYADSAPPTVTPDDQAMNDSVLRVGPRLRPGVSTRAVIAHHRQAIGMIDDYLPRARRAEPKALAERMRKDHLEEIKLFERKAK